MNEFVSDHIRISLTELARKVLESDRVIFGASANSNLTYSELVNRIIVNFDDEFNLNEDLLTLDADNSRSIRLQEKVIDTLSEVDISRYLQSTPKPSVPKYVRCLLESFARLPFIEREKLLLKSIIDQIEKSLQSKKNLRIKYRGESLVVTPISIAPAKEGAFQYLIGSDDSAKILSIRLSRIESIKSVGKSNFIPSTIKKQIEADLAEFGPTFITEPKVEIKVRFTLKGLNSYKYSVIHRPVHTSTQGDDIYIFNCSEKQAMYFFFRFAGDIEILEPLSLRNKIRDLYQAGLNKYL